MRFTTIIAAAVLLVSPAVFAQKTPDTAAIKASIERLTGGKVKVDRIQPTPAAGIFEVVSDGEVFYSDASGRYGFVGGALVDMQHQKDLTAPAVERLTSLPFSSLPLKYAVKQVNGSGKRQLAVFEDPNCPICRVFTKFLDQIDDVTIYRFMFPVIDPSSQALAKVAWCSADRAGAWKLIMDGRRFDGRQDCDVTGLVETLKFGEKHKIQNTPTVFLSNGKRLVGATPPEQFIAELNATAAR